SQPCKLKPSFCQWMLLASPHAGLSAALREVICFHSLIAPAHISGGWASDWRITAAILPSAAREIAVPHPLAFNWPGPRTSVSMAPELGSTLAIPLSPSTSSPKRILPSLVHVSQLAEAFMPGVIFFASPPAAGMIKISPPTAGSSLIMPEMKATDLPSGDNAGTAICESLGGV